MILPEGVNTEGLLDAMSTATVFLDTRLNVMHMNVAAELMLGASRKMSEGRNIFDVFPCCEAISLQIRKALETQRAYSERDLQISLTPQHKITLDSIITPVFNDDLVTEYVIIELTQVDRRLRITKEDHLLSQGEGTRDLLRGVAHEIKNPLGGIRGAAQLLAGELTEPDHKEYTQVITTEVDRLQNLLDRMLGPRQMPVIDQVNIHEILEDVRRLITAESAFNIKLIVDYDPSLPEITADKDMLKQSLLNLANNAMHAVKDLETPRIIFRTRPERQFTIGHTRHRLVMRIEIIDNGPGIPEELRETIFLPMVTNKPEGTGLGLPIAQSLVQRHGGLIEYDDCDGHTCFVVYLPLETPYANH